MREVKWEITEEDYMRYAKMSHAELQSEVEGQIPDAWRYGYGWYGCRAVERGGKFYLEHMIGGSCD